MIRTSIILLILLMSLPSIASADDAVPIPWTEFKALYRESIEKEVMEQFPDPPSTQQYGIDAAEYTISVEGSLARGGVLISGRVFSGEPAPIHIFSGTIIINAVLQTSGGALICGADNTGAIAFLPAGTGPFEIAVDFVIPVEEDAISRLFTLRIPPALRNELKLKMAANLELIETPGLAKANGSIHFAATNHMTVRFSEKERPLSKRPAYADLFVQITPEREKTVVAAAIVPLLGLPVSYLLTIPEGFHYAAPPTPGIQVQVEDSATLRIHMEKETQLPGQITLEREETSEAGRFALQLPRIINNRGRQGNFLIQPLNDGEIEFINSHEISTLPEARLHSKFRPLILNPGGLYHIASEAQLSYTVTRYRPMETPPVVLDTISFYSAFEENGHTLSLLSLEVPPEAGRRMAIRPVPDAKIWWVKVNGENRQIYTGNSDDWIVPLSSGCVSRVELAFLRESSPMGLSGRLETVLPETGLPARQVHICIALPERVELTALEGPVTPDKPQTEPLPHEVTGTPYFFAHKFYQGNPIHLAVSYKEPVRDASASVLHSSSTDSPDEGVERVICQESPVNGLTE